MCERLGAARKDVLPALQLGGPGGGVTAITWDYVWSVVCWTT